MTKPMLILLLISILPLATAQETPAPSTTTSPATTRAADPVVIRVDGVPETLTLNQVVTARIEFRNALPMPLAFQTRDKLANLHLKIWRDGKRIKSPAFPVGDGIATIKQGESVFAEINLTALGLTREAGRYLVVADAMASLDDEKREPGKPPIQIPVSATIKFVTAAK